MTFSIYCTGGDHTKCRGGQTCECTCHVSKGAAGKRLNGIDFLTGWPPIGYEQKTDGRIFGYGPRPFGKVEA
jgi:hypothetical protein